MRRAVLPASAPSKIGGYGVRVSTASDVSSPESAVSCYNCRRQKRAMRELQCVFFLGAGFSKPTAMQAVELERGIATRASCHVDAIANPRQ